MKPRKAAAAPPRAQQPEAESELAARRSRQELAKGEKLGVLALIDPPAPLHEFAPEIPQVRDRTAEGCRTELEERRQDFERAAARLSG